MSDSVEVTPTKEDETTLQRSKGRRSLSRLFAGLAIGIGLGLVLFSGLKLRTGLDSTEDPASLEEAPAVGSRAPGFELYDLKGNRIGLKDTRGKYVLINFWATWCAPCRIEMPAIQSRFERHKADFTVLAVDFDEPAGVVQAFVDELGLTFPILLDPGAKVQRLYQVRGYPTSVFVDRQGIVRIVHIGLMTETQLDGYLAQLGVGE
jgi:peroxiredoxin